MRSGRGAGRRFRTEDRCGRDGASGFLEGDSETLAGLFEQDAVVKNHDDRGAADNVVGAFYALDSSGTLEEGIGSGGAAGDNGGADEDVLEARGSVLHDLCGGLGG